MNAMDLRHSRMNGWDLADAGRRDPKKLLDMVVHGALGQIPRPERQHIRAG